jgi:hypothetical protein
MKKLILLLFIPLVFTCSSDDSKCLTCTNVDFYTTPWGENGDTFHCNEDLIVCEGDTLSSVCFVGANIWGGDGTDPLESWEIDAIKSFYESNGASCYLE